MRSLSQTRIPQTCHMEPMINQGQLEALAHHLQDCLQQADVTEFETLQRQTVPIQIYCVLKGINLMVLGQHPATPPLEPMPVLTTLERSIQTLPPTLMASVFDPKILPCRAQVKLYLRAIGQKQPYVLREFVFVPVFIASLEALENELQSRDAAHFSPALPQDSLRLESTLRKEIPERDAAVAMPGAAASLATALAAGQADGRSDFLDRSAPTFERDTFERDAFEQDAFERDRVGTLDHASWNDARDEYPGLQQPAVRDAWHDHARLQDDQAQDNQAQDDQAQDDHSQAHPSQDDRFHNAAPALRDEPLPESPPSAPRQNAFRHDQPLPDQSRPAEPLEDTAPDPNAPDRLGSDLSLGSDLMVPQPKGFSYKAAEVDAPLPWRAIALVGGITAMLSGLFVFTRPCVTDACQPLQTANNLNREFVKTVQSAQTVEDLKRAQTKLADLNRQLQQVPRWSSRFGDAQALQVRSQTQTADLDKVLAAMDQAAQASRRPPETVPTPRDIDKQKGLWQAAIAQLDSIPNYSPLYAFAQARLTEFQDNLANLNRQSLSPEQTRQKLAAAKAAAAKAQERQAAAKTQEDWQLAKATWLTAVKALQEIPPSAENYGDGQQLLPGYQAQVAVVGDRLKQIQQANQTYTQALAIADRARTLEQQNQWTLAVSTWREAISRAQQVSAQGPNSTYAEQAQPLIGAYSAALKQAESQLQGVMAQQRVKTDLAQVCTGTEKICNFTIAPDAIRLQLTPAYEQSLGRAFAVGQTTDPGTYSKTVHHIDTLQAALQTICNNAGLPLEVYNASGAEMVGSFSPQG